MEREAGIPLLERAGRGVRPAPAGALLSQHAELVYAQLSKAEAELADLKAGRTDGWRSGTSPPPARPWFPRRWPPCAIKDSVAA